MLWSIVDPDSADQTAFRNALNMVCTQYINSGKWKGTIVEVTFAADLQGHITLPPFYQSALSSRYRYCTQAPIFTQFHEYVEGGIGELDDTREWAGILIDMGDGFCTTVDIITGGPLRLTSSASDNGKTVRIYGNDLNGREIFDSSGNAGVNVTLAAPSVSTAESFSFISGVDKALTNFPVSLYVIEGGVDVQLARYLPSETRISYRRYKTGIRNQILKTLCQRRPFPVYADTDWVIPGNLPALEIGLQAYMMRGGNFTESYQGMWDAGLALLNQEARAQRGGARPDVLIDQFANGLGGALPWAH